MILAGELYRGATGLAGEIAHVQVDEMGHPCNCGARGCLGIQMFTIASHGETVDRNFRLIGDLVQRCEDGDGAAGRILARVGGLLGEHLGALANVLDPARVVISTDRVPPHETLLDGVRQGIRRTALPFVADLTVVASTLGIHAETLGGIVLARYRAGASSRSSTAERMSGSYTA